MRLLDLYDAYLLTVMMLVKLARWSHSRWVCDALAGTIARFACSMPGAKRRNAVTTLELCLKDTHTPKQRSKILQGTYLAFWQDVFALAFSPSMAAEMSRRVRVQGLDHLQRALKSGRGAILIESSFFGRRNLAKMVLHAGDIAVAQVHALTHIAGFSARRETRLRSHVIRPFLERCELQFMREIVVVSGDNSLAFTRVLSNVLRENRVLCLSGDGRIGQKSVAIPFLGCERAFMTGMMSLGKYAGSAVLPLFCWKDAEGQIHLVIEAPLDLQAGPKSETGTAAYANLLEAYILRYPSEYHGWHWSE